MLISQESGLHRKLAVCVLWEEEEEEEGLIQGHALGNTAAQPYGRKAVCLEPLQAVTVDTPGSGLPVPLLWQ